MGGWISQAKKKLFDIIEQTKKDIENLELRVAYIGYVVTTFTCRQSNAYIVESCPTSARTGQTKRIETILSIPTHKLCYARRKPPPMFKRTFVTTHTQPIPPSRLLCHNSLSTGDISVSSFVSLIACSLAHASGTETDECMIRHHLSFYCVVTGGSYRDYGRDGHVKSNQYEGPYDFHSEDELPELEAKLEKISAGGGTFTNPILSLLGAFFLGQRCRCDVKPGLY